MAEQRVQRRLAAILSADVVGYSRLIEADEEGTRARLRALQSELILPQIEAAGGRIVKTTGDGVLAEFASAVGAVGNALSIQAAMLDHNQNLAESQRLVFRIGINVGDVLVEGDDVHGDGVNVAARLEALCEPGQVYVSGNVYDQVVGKIDASFDNLGEQVVKNIARPIRIYCARSGREPGFASGEAGGAVVVPTAPSIAVLPFKNLSPDPSQDYFVDGLRLAIQSSFVHVPGLQLIAPPGVDRYRTQDVAAERVARELGVRYVLEGAAQPSGQRIRVTVQLTDAHNRQVVWMEHYDRDISDLLATQDEIAVNVVKVVDSRVASSNLALMARGTLTSLEALRLYYRGLNHFYGRTKDDNAAAKHEFEKVFRLQPDSTAPSYLSICHLRDASMGWSDSKNQSLMQAVEWAEKGLTSQYSNGMPQIVLAYIHLINRRHEEALATCYQAIELRPACPVSIFTLAEVLHYCGHSAEAVPKAKAAMRLLQVYPSWFLTLLAASYRDLGNLDQSVATALKAQELNPKDIDSRLVLCSDYVAAGQPERAQRLAQEIIDIEPSFSLAAYAAREPYRDEGTLNALVDGLRTAGLPD